MNLSDLTAEAIDALEAGPELDLLVGQAAGMRVEIRNDSEDPCGVCYETLGTSGIGCSFMPSFRIADAWRLVELMADKTKEQAVEIYSDLSEGLSWRCGLLDYLDICIVFAHAPTTPLAICRCFLKAKLAEEKP